MLCNLGCTFTLHGGSIRLLVWKTLLSLILPYRVNQKHSVSQWEAVCFTLPCFQGCPASNKGWTTPTKKNKANVGGQDLSKMLNQKIEIPFKASRWLCARTGGQFAPLCLNSLRKEMTKHISKTNFFHLNIQTHGPHLGILMAAWLVGML